MASESPVVVDYGGDGFVNAEETMERLDRRQMLFDRTGDAHTFRFVSSDSLDVTFATHNNATDSAAILVKLVTPDLGFDDAYVG
ncbi:hypothetical protein THARTR1_04481 [Trichoderma harzianum]|uniref:Uncharacterized protein n=1 Tax=Trichoderma harzianum TaxID=5544 RepID=A0A2K0UC36_TRIHA|nr:hypothetical protein THARTR1_04481 [Trichoderma harzianum]